MVEQWIIPVLTGTSVIAIGGSLILNRVVKRAPLEARLAAVGRKAYRSKYDDDLEDLSLAGTSVRSGSLLLMMLHMIKSLSPKDTSTTLRESLTQAGYHNKDAAQFYLGSKFILV